MAVKPLAPSLITKNVARCCQMFLYSPPRGGCKILHAATLHLSYASAKPNCLFCPYHSACSLAPAFAGLPSSIPADTRPICRGLGQSRTSDDFPLPATQWDPSFPWTHRQQHPKGCRNQMADIWKGEWVGGFGLFWAQLSALNVGYFCK